jgi:hypothetical protein
MKKDKTTFVNNSNKSIPIVPMDGIHRQSFDTTSGNRIAFFFNKETNLLVIDIIDKNERGGNELVRMTLDEKKLLNHL